MKERNKEEVKEISKILLQKKKKKKGGQGNNKKKNAGKEMTVCGYRKRKEKAGMLKKIKLTGGIY